MTTEQLKQLKQAKQAGCKTDKDFTIFESGYLNGRRDTLDEVTRDIKDYAAEEIESLRVYDPIDGELSKKDNESVKLIDMEVR